MAEHDAPDSKSDNRFPEREVEQGGHNRRAALHCTVIALLLAFTGLWGRWDDAKAAGGAVGQVARMIGHEAGGDLRDPFCRVLPHGASLGGPSHSSTSVKSAIMTRRVPSGKALKAMRRYWRSHAGCGSTRRTFFGPDTSGFVLMRTRCRSVSRSRSTRGALPLH